MTEMGQKTGYTADQSNTVMKLQQQKQHKVVMSFQKQSLKLNK
jgi:hypothetical protein